MNERPAAELYRADMSGSFLIDRQVMSDISLVIAMAYLTAAAASVFTTVVNGHDIDRRRALLGSPTAARRMTHTDRRCMTDFLGRHHYIPSSPSVRAGRMSIFPSAGSHRTYGDALP